MIIACSAHQLRSHKIKKDIDDKFNGFDKHMVQYHNYLNFKTDNPYAEVNPNFEHIETPVTTLDRISNKMSCYLPDEDSRRAHIEAVYGTPEVNRLSRIKGNLLKGRAKFIISNKTSAAGQALSRNIMARSAEAKQNNNNYVR